MLQCNEIIKIVEGISLHPDMKLDAQKLRAGRSKVVLVSLKARVLNADYWNRTIPPITEVCSSIYIRPDQAHSPHDVIKMVEMMVRGLYEHEHEEWFRYQGRRVHDPHDPFGVSRKETFNV